MIDLIGWTGSSFLFTGLYLVGNKNIKGFYLCLLANALYLWQSILLNMSSLIVLDIVTSILYIRSIIQWKKGFKNENLPKI